MIAQSMVDDDVIGPTLPRLLTAVGSRHQSDALALRVHRETFAPPPLPRRHPIESSIAAIESSGLRGRGGAGFPNGRKLRSVSQGRGRPVVIVNGSEGEPASRKDALLLSRAPHLVLDGALHAAAAVGAREVFVCIEGTQLAAISAIERAIAERVSAGEPMVPLTVVDLPARYVAGEETALVNFIDSGRALPKLTPPRPYESGVGGRPTLIDNVETLCHVAQIMRWGPVWFRSQGTADEPGTALLTLSGAVSRAGVCEVPIGMSMQEVLFSAGPIGEVGAVLLGGFYGTWLSATDARWATLDNDHLRSIGSSMGCGAVIVMSKDACGIRETARVLSWLAGETAGQCGPCVHGLAALAAGMTELASGRPTAHIVGSLERWSGQIEGRGACSFPDGAVRLLRSALRVFHDDVVHHLHHGPCAAAGRPPAIVVPSTRSIGRR
jgi:NADH:ubiquinone oxidoreductase subunit F (NADH-binding)